MPTASPPAQPSLLARLRAFLTGGVESVSPREAARLLAETDALLLDVRTLAEWQGGHAPSAKHVPLDKLASEMRSLPRDRPIIVQCASGMRSRVGARRLRAAGFGDVKNLSGGLAAWRRDGLPVAR